MLLSAGLRTALLVACVFLAIPLAAPQGAGGQNYRNAITCAECLVVDAGGADYVNTTLGQETNFWGTPCNGTVCVCLIELDLGVAL